MKQVDGERERQRVKERAKAIFNHLSMFTGYLGG